MRSLTVLRRIRSLVIPPAWTDVWICAYTDGHLQAAGTDAAGRRQYLYHTRWRDQRDRLKFDHVLEIAERLPAFRARVDRDLADRGLTRARVLAAAARMLDVGFFRVGTESYDTYGLATLRMEHATCADGTVTFLFLAKGEIEQEIVVRDPAVCAVVRSLKALADEGDLLRYHEDGAWSDVRSQEINDYLREAAGCEITAKDFRTWHATVLAAVGLAVSRNSLGRRRAVARVMREVSAYLGNTPAVVRASYVDPRVVEAFEAGVTISLDDLGEAAGRGRPATHGRVERAVIRLLRDRPAVRSRFAGLIPVRRGRRLFR